MIIDSVSRWVGSHWVDGYMVSGQLVGGSVVRGFIETQEMGYLFFSILMIKKK